MLSHLSQGNVPSHSGSHLLAPHVGSKGLLESKPCPLSFNNCREEGEEGRSHASHCNPVIFSLVECGIHLMSAFTLAVHEKDKQPQWGVHGNGN